MCAGGGLSLCVALAGCSSQKIVASKTDPNLGVAPSPVVIADGKPVPKGGGVYQVGKPYKVAGRFYTPKDPGNYSAVGLASWYGDAFHGRRTANGEIYDKTALSAAHPTLPLPSYVRVTNVSNNRSIIVRVNDRGPFHRGRLIDVSKRTADLLGFRLAGVGRVKIDYVGLASISGSDDRKLLATYTENGQPAQLGGAQSQLASLFQPPPPPEPPPPRPVTTIAANTGPAPVQGTAAVQVAIAHSATPAPVAVASVQGSPPLAPAPPIRPAVPVQAVAAARPAPSLASTTLASTSTPASYAPAPVVQQVAATVPVQPQPPVADARARIMLSWGGITAPMPLAAADTTLPPTTTALSSY